MELFLFFYGLAALFFMAYWTCRIAEQKGYSSLGFFFFSFSFPLLALLVAGMVPNRNVP